MREYYRRKLFYDGAIALFTKHRMYMNHLFKVFNGSDMTFAEYCRDTYMTIYDCRIRACKANLRIVKDYQNIVCENAVKSLLDNYDKEDKPNANKW
jgi:hypothetical protein